MGARKLDRIDQGLKAGAVMGCVYAVIAFAVLCIFGQWIALMFVDKGEGEILRNTRLFLIGNSLFYIPLVFVNAVRFMIQGLGYSRLAVIAGVCEMAARSFVGFCLVPVFGYIAVCIASPVAWIAADLFLIPAYRHVMKNLNQLFTAGAGPQTLHSDWESKRKANKKAAAENPMKDNAAAFLMYECRKFVICQNMFIPEGLPGCAPRGVPAEVCSPQSGPCGCRACGSCPVSAS